MKKLWIIITVGIILRVFLSVTTFHSDIEAFNLGGRLIASGKTLDLYDYSSDAAILNYPPPIYWFHGLFKFLFSNIFGINQPTNLLLKLPYLIFDLLIAFILMRLVDPKKALLVFLFWMFNPVNLYATYMMGQFDIIPTFFSLLSVYFINRNKLYWAALALGTGTAFKLYPIFLLIPLIVLGRNFLDKFKLIILAILPYLLSIAPYITSASFRSTALFANQSSKSLYAAIPVSGGESILLFPLSLVFFYLVIWSKKVEKIYFWRLYLIPLLLFFIFTHFHPQWLIWITPFLIVDLLSSGIKSLLPVLLIFVSWVGLLFFFDTSLTVGIFAPLFPTLSNTPSIWTLLNLSVDYNFSRSILQTVFAAASFYIIYRFYHRENNV